MNNNDRFWLLIGSETNLWASLSVVWYVCHGFLKRGRKFHFHAPTGELVLSQVDIKGPVEKALLEVRNILQNI